jgi:glyoxylase-like metal-dependent hydrolase (beta-lactamase superfamily II)
MVDHKMTVGNVEITHLYDLVADFGMTLDQLFPTVPTEAWEPYRRAYPSVFGEGNAWRYHAGCYLIRSRGRTILVDTGVGPSSLGMATWLGTGGQLPDRLRAGGVSPEEVETVVFTHLHPDHVGWNLQQEGGQYRPTFPRARYLAHRADWDTFRRPEVQQALAGVAGAYVEQTLTPLESLGALDLADGERSLSEEVTALHTPGHTPGSQCLLVGGRLVAGDTLFLEGCGRTDLPGSDAEQMYDSLSRLAALPDDVIVYPGHRYSMASSGTVAAIRESNYVFRPKSKQAWLAMFGAS